MRKYHLVKKWKWYVYILELNNGRYYTGITWNPAVRLEQHLSKLGSAYTARYGVKHLVFMEQHSSLETARIREHQIKDFSQKKKRMLIETYKGFSR